MFRLSYSESLNMTDTTPGSPEALSGDPVALARDLVRVPSVNPVLEEGGAGEAGIAELTASWLRDWGLETEVVEVEAGRPNVVAVSRSGEPGRTLLLNGHLDTVGVAGMSVAPFDGSVEGGRLVGRGACDMKAGLAAILATARVLARDGHAGTLIVALTADEEHASLGMQAVVGSGVSADGAVVCEPTSLTVMPANKGFVWMEASFRGRAAHGSRPEEGQDAIMDAAAFLTALEELGEALTTRDPHPLLAHGSLHAGTVRGGSAPSVYPERCEVVVERRTLPGEGAEEVEAEFEDVLEAVRRTRPGLDAELTAGLSRPGTEVAADHPLVSGLLAALKAEGERPVVEGMTAWVDAALLNEAGIPAVCFGPGSIAQAHSADEYVDVEEIRRGTRVLLRFCREFLSGRAGRG
jgi:acetylornithine deacetylase